MLLQAWPCSSVDKTNKRQHKTQVYSYRTNLLCPMWAYTTTLRYGAIHSLNLLLSLQLLPVYINTSGLHKLSLYLNMCCMKQFLWNMQKYHYKLLNLQQITPVWHSKNFIYRNQLLITFSSSVTKFTSNTLARLQITVNHWTIIVC